MLTAKRKQIAEHFAAQDLQPDAASPTIVTPSQTALVVNADHQLKSMRWGLRSTWEVASGQRLLLINARAETLAQKPTFRTLLEQQRCLVPANGFFEWEKLPGGRKRPVYFRSHQHELLAFAGLWEQQLDATGNTILAFTIITTAANETIRVVHDRMPALLAPEAAAAWIKPEQTVGDALALLKPYTDRPLIAEDGTTLLTPQQSEHRLQPLLPF